MADEAESLTQLIHFITHQPYQIHHITKTELLTTLIQQLIITQPTHHGRSIKLTIDALIIILPRVASLIRTYLPFLFIAFAKILIRSSHHHHQQQQQQQQQQNPLHLSHSILNLFNLLYGIAPCNLIEFLRNPSHLTHAFSLGLPIDPPDHVLGYQLLQQSIQPSDLQDLFPVDKLHALVAPMMHRHRLNKNLILMTASSELKEISNRLKMYEPADLIEKCERNLIQEDPARSEYIVDLLGDPSSIDQPTITETNPQEDLELPTQLSLSSPVHTKFPALPIVYPKFDLPVSEPSPEVLNPQPSSSPTSNNDDSPAQDPLPTSSDARVEELQTENKMLKTQLHLELYLKSQHLQQLGSVHKQNILDASLEAENQNLLRMNRELRKKLAKSEESKQESQSAKMMTIKNKLAYQELIKKKNLDLKKDNLNFLNAKFVLQNQINELEKVVEVQNRNLLLVQSEAHDLRNQLTLIEPSLQKLSGLESTTETLSRALLTWDDDLRRFRESRSHIERLMGQWKLSESMATSLEESNGHSKPRLSDCSERTSSCVPGPTTVGPSRPCLPLTRAPNTSLHASIVLTRPTPVSDSTWSRLANNKTLSPRSRTTLLLIAPNSSLPPLYVSLSLGLTRHRRSLCFLQDVVAWRSSHTHTCFSLCESVCPCALPMYSPS